MTDRQDIETALQAGFRSWDREGLASLVPSGDFALWVNQESGWRPAVVSGRTNQGMVNGGLFQFWYGHDWARPHFSHGNDPKGTFTMSVMGQAQCVVRYFPHITAESVRKFAAEIRAGTYRGWG